jgi:hypothetical protein
MGAELLLYCPPCKGGTKRSEEGVITSGALLLNTLSFQLPKIFRMEIFEVQ